MIKTVIAAAFFAASVLAQAPCPLTITKVGNGFKSGMTAALVMDGPRWARYLTVDYTNTSTKTIVATRFGIQYVNALKELHNLQMIDSPKLKLRPGKRSALISPDASLGNDGVVGWLAKAMFSDGTYWLDDGTKACQNFDATK